MFFGYLVLLVALAIAAVAAYFSVYGLVALFAAAAIQVAVMGVSLEIGKLVTAAWLHKSWSKAPWLLKTYLTSALIVLMLITSIGIYGFLSKGHLEQQAPLATMQAQIERNVLSINSYTSEVAILREQLVTVSETENKTSEQTDDARKQRIQAQIDEQNQLLAPIDRQIELQRETITRLETQIATLDSQIEAYNAAGAVTRGREALAAQQEERASINSRIDAASEKIVEFENNKLEINAAISKLRQEMFSPVDVDVDNTTTSRTDDISNKINDLNAKIKELEDTNLDLNIKMSETTAKLGPIQYVADLLGMDDKEKAVQLLIVLIMFAFDPVAVSLLIAAQWTISQKSNTKEEVNKKNTDEKSHEPTVNAEVNAHVVVKADKPTKRETETETKDQPTPEPILEVEQDHTEEVKTDPVHEEVGRDFDPNEGVAVETEGIRKVEKHIQAQPQGFVTTKGWLDKRKD